MSETEIVIVGKGESFIDFHIVARIQLYSLKVSHYDAFLKISGGKTTVCSESQYIFSI